MTLLMTNPLVLAPPVAPLPSYHVSTSGISGTEGDYFEDGTYNDITTGHNPKFTFGDFFIAYVGGAYNIIRASSGIFLYRGPNTSVGTVPSTGWTLELGGVNPVPTVVLNP